MEYINGWTLLKWVLARYGIPWCDGKEDVRWRIKNDRRVMRAFEIFKMSRDADCVSMRRALRRAYAHVHKRHIVHNDVKPANILCSINGTGEPRIWLLDFEEATIRWNARKHDRKECALWFGA